MSDLHCRECGSTNVQRVTNPEQDGWECNDCSCWMGPLEFQPAAEPGQYSDRPKFEVCPICQGEGKYVNPSIDSQGLSQEQMDELGDEFREDYLRGAYDVRCKCCNGDRVVTKAQLRDYEERLGDHRTRMAESGELYGDSRL